ncbi:transposase DDE domain protein [Rickettsia amblyommatis str. Ac/Pa]|uniref:Transposase DDE domain protein n=1 Tax=Rickettsia amblyommatis str. Ac/Pa TaxID=1359164 RepID=A0A0F3N292_RICAM|nr:transposase DDE domain protein [Rickettsia amblyommatis str. Ac/Pa]
MAQKTYYMSSPRRRGSRKEQDKRTSNNRVFSNIAKIGMSSYGWFMGFKLHIELIIKVKLWQSTLPKQIVVIYQ